MASRLKVYEARLDGSAAWIVAAPNQQAALDAWGVRQNLFQQGEAAPATDPDVIAAALAQPGVPLRRPRDAQGGFEPLTTPDVHSWTVAAKAVGARKPGPSLKRPDTRAVEKARQDLARFDAQAESQIRALTDARQAAERAEQQARQKIDRQRQILKAKIDRLTLA